VNQGDGKDGLNNSFNDGTSKEAKKVLKGRFARDVVLGTERVSEKCAPPRTIRTTIITDGTTRVMHKKGQ